MITDIRGNYVTGADQAAVGRFDTALELFHGYYGNPLGAVDALIAEAPAFAMAHNLRAVMLAMSTEQAALPALLDSVRAVEALGARANDRERRHAAAARAWFDGAFDRAQRTWGEILADHPTDTLAMQAAHLCDFYLGQSRLLRDRIAAALRHLSPDMPGYGYALGMHAFGLEENGDYALAEVEGRRALSLNRRDPWAVHAVAHVMEMQGRPEDGIQWLEDRAQDWAPENGFAFHNFWHLALFHLDRGNTAAALHLYDVGVHPENSGVQLEMVDASALLWRLHLRGVHTATRWQALAEAWAPLAGEAFYAFNDVHAMMAFVANRSSREADAVIEALERRTSQGGTNARMTHEVGLPLCRALQAFGRGDWETCVRLLLQVRPVAARFGGSHAQRDVISLTLLEAALRGGMHELADGLARQRLDDRPRSPFNLHCADRARALVASVAARADASPRPIGLAA
jgi:tetratricopeptide (TPR) repeat protein